MPCGRQTQYNAHGAAFKGGRCAWVAQSPKWIVIHLASVPRTCCDPINPIALILKSTTATVINDRQETSYACVRCRARLYRRAGLPTNHFSPIAFPAPIKPIKSIRHTACEVKNVHKYHKCNKWINTIGSIVFSV
jgi:hypothetical protein